MPGGNLVKVVAIGKLIWTAVEDVKPLAHLRKVCRSWWLLGQPIWKLVAMVSATNPHLSPDPDLSPNRSRPKP